MIGIHKSLLLRRKTKVVLLLIVIPAIGWTPMEELTMNRFGLLLC